MHSYLQYMFDYMGYSTFTTNLHGLPEGDSVDEWVSYRVYILNWDSFEYKKRATFQTSCHLLIDRTASKRLDFWSDYSWAKSIKYFEWNALVVVVEEEQGD